jgi:hypothetical protein
VLLKAASYESVDDAHAGAARRRSDHAVEMKELIERHAGPAVWVQGVVAVWGQLPEPVVERDKVLYVSAPRLVETLENRPLRLTDVERSGVNEALERIHSPRA